MGEIDESVDKPEEKSLTESEQAAKEAGDSIAAEVNGGESNDAPDPARVKEEAGNNLRQDAASPTDRPVSVDNKDGLSVSPADFWGRTTEERSGEYRRHDPRQEAEGRTQKSERAPEEVSLAAIDEQRRLAEKYKGSSPQISFDHEWNITVKDQEGKILERREVEQYVPDRRPADELARELTPGYRQVYENMAKDRPEATLTGSKPSDGTNEAPRPYDGKPLFNPDAPKEHTIITPSLRESVGAHLSGKTDEQIADPKPPPIVPIEHKDTPSPGTVVSEFHLPAPPADSFKPPPGAAQAANVHTNGPAERDAAAAQLKETGAGGSGKEVDSGNRTSAGSVSGPPARHDSNSAAQEIPARHAGAPATAASSAWQESKTPAEHSGAPDKSVQAARRDREEQQREQFQPRGVIEQPQSKGESRTPTDSSPPKLTSTHPVASELARKSQPAENVEMSRLPVEQPGKHGNTPVETAGNPSQLSARELQDRMRKIQEFEPQAGKKSLESIARNMTPQEKKALDSAHSQFKENPSIDNKLHGQKAINETATRAGDESSARHKAKMAAGSDSSKSAE